MANRGEPLLHARRRELARAGLDPRGDVHRLHGGDRRHAGAYAPSKEFFRSSSIRSARVRVADIAGEEFEVAHAGVLPGGDDERRGWARGDRDERVHVLPQVSKRVSNIRAVNKTTCRRNVLSSSSDKPGCDPCGWRRFIKPFTNPRPLSSHSFKSRLKNPT